MIHTDILRETEITGAELPLVARADVYSPLADTDRNKLTGKVATNDARPRWNRADVSISRESVFFGLARATDPRIRIAL